MRQLRDEMRIALAVATALAWLVTGSPAAAEEVVRIGDLPQLSTAALYVAMEKGYFSQAGIRLDTQNFASAAKMTPALATGELDVATGAPSAGLFNAIASGQPIKIVADKGQVRPGHSGTLLVIRKDLVESGQVKSLKELKGRTISTGAKAITTEYFLAKMLEDAGVPYNAVNITYLSYPDGVKALASKAIDGFWGPEPWGARAEEQKVGVRFALPEQVKSTATFQVGVVIFAGKFIKERTKVARDFLAAYVKGAKYYNDKGPKNDEIVTMLAKHTKVPVETIKASHPFWIAPDGRPRGEDMLALQDFMLSQGWIKAKVPLDKLLDLSLLP